MQDFKYSIIAIRMNEITTNPELMVARLNDAVLAVNAQDFAKGAQIYQSVIDSGVIQYAEIWDRLAHCYVNLRQFDKALVCINQVVQLNPTILSYYNRIAINLELGNYSQALSDGQSIFYHADATDANKGDICLKMAMICDIVKDYNKAIFYCEKSVKFNPNPEEYQKRWAFVNFHAGNYTQAFQIYQYRYKTFDGLNFNQLNHHTQDKIWRGQDFQGKTLLIAMEQGFGDMIMMMRYIPKLRAMGAQIIIETFTDFVKLFACDENFSDCQIILGGTEPPNFDYWMMAMSMPCVADFATNIPPNPYFQAGQTPVVLESDKKIKIGLVWASGKLFQDAHSKSIGLENLLPLINDFSNRNIQFYGLQIGENADDIRKLNLSDKIIDCSPFIYDFYDSAGFMKQLDLIISVDTSAAHLAGALGVPCWLMINYDNTWRWHDKENSIWYPNNFTIIRQETPKNWQSCVQKAISMVESMVDKILPREIAIQPPVQLWMFQAQQAIAQKNYQLAKISYDKILEHDENFIPALKGRIEVAHHIREYQTGIADCMRLLQLDISPEDKGKVCLALSLLHQKLWTFDNHRFLAIKALELAQQFPHNQLSFNRHLMFGQLRLMDWQTGFRFYQNRHSVNEFASFILKPWHDLNKTWQNQPVDTLLIVMEQGFGDMIQFCRYIPKIRHKTKKIIIESYPELAGLMKFNFPDAEVYFDVKENIQYNAMVLMASLPNYLENIADITDKTPYINALAVELPLPALPKLKIGIAWSSGGQGTDHLIKSMKLKDLMPIFHKINADFFSLQIGDAVHEIHELGLGGIVKDLSPFINNFYDTASFCKNLDCIITIDSSVAHLAGAMGMKNWVFLSKISDWRWGITNHSDFYNENTILIRQNEYDDWRAPVQAFIAQFQEYFADKL